MVSEVVKVGYQSTRTYLTLLQTYSRSPNGLFKRGTWANTSGLWDSSAPLSPLLQSTTELDDNLRTAALSRLLEQIDQPEEQGFSSLEVSLLHMQLNQKSA